MKHAGVKWHVIGRLCAGVELPTTRQIACRASVPLHSVDAHTDKVLCAAWMDTGAAATGGADGRLVVLRVPPLLAQ